MKGVVFTEFLQLVESEFGLEVADRIIDKAKLETGGAYTTVGTYDHGELLQLVVGLSEETNIPAAELVQTFGGYLFGRFVEGFPQFFDRADTTFEFLAGVEDYIHIEVRKLYPDAELPTFEHDVATPGQMEMNYRSSRPFADLAEGLIRACIAHFGEEIDVQREDLLDKDGTAARFLLSARKEAPACTS